MTHKGLDNPKLRIFLGRSTYMPNRIDQTLLDYKFQGRYKIRFPPYKSQILDFSTCINIPSSDQPIDGDL